MDLLMLIVVVVLVVLSGVLLIERLRAPELSAPPPALLPALVVLGAVGVLLAVLSARWLNALSLGGMTALYGLMFIQLRRARRSA